MLSGHSTFKGVNSLAFVRFSGRVPLIKEKVILARTTEEWFQKLREDRAKNLALAQRGTAGQRKSLNRHGWAVLVTYESTGELWIPYWKVTNKRDPDGKIWSITYEAHPSQPAVSESRIEDAVAKLRRALEASKHFARTHQLDFWIEWFSCATGLLFDPTPEIPYYPDLVPTTYDPEARRLIAAASKSWVFGGMGSWSDLVFDDPASSVEYHVVTEQLYDAVVSGILAAINSSRCEFIEG
jgi:hypothetical protein